MLLSYFTRFIWFLSFGCLDLTLYMSYETNKIIGYRNQEFDLD